MVVCKISQFPFEMASLLLGLFSKRNGAEHELENDADGGWAGVWVCDVVA
jgi:hypothetical protein